MRARAHMYVFFFAEADSEKKKEGAHIVYSPLLSKNCVWVVDTTKECLKTEPPLTSQKKTTTT